MPRLTSRLFQRMLSNKGYTIDQTILIVAIIAILITLVIVTVGWQLINRTSGTKAGAQIKQIEDANGQFFSAHRVWPHMALDAAGTPTTSMAVLVNASIPVADWSSSVNTADLRNLLPGFKVVGTGAAAVVYHSFGSSANATVTQQANTMATVGADPRMVVQFREMPLSDAKEADRAIDGTEDATKGRVIYGPTACLRAAINGAATIPTVVAPTDSMVYVCYAANTTQ